MYDARSVTNWFIERGQQEGKPLTIMALLKLIYIAHGWNLALRDAPLFGNTIEAWTFGPVVPDVYYAFRKQGVTPAKPSPKHPTVADEDGIDLLRQVYDLYAHLSAWQLSRLTHVAGGPWETAIKWGGSFAVIPDELIRAHYIVLLHEHERENGD